MGSSKRIDSNRAKGIGRRAVVPGISGRTGVRVASRRLSRTSTRSWGDCRMRSRWSRRRRMRCSERRSVREVRRLRRSATRSLPYSTEFGAFDARMTRWTWRSAQLGSDYTQAKTPAYSGRRKRTVCLCLRPKRMCRTITAMGLCDVFNLGGHLSRGGLLSFKSSVTQDC